MQTNRSSNFELLRIFAMLMIVGAHFAGHGIRHVLVPELSSVWLSGSFANRLFTSFLIPGGKIGVGIFFVLTGYFMYTAQYKASHLIKLVLQVYFYSFTIQMGGGYSLRRILQLPTKSLVGQFLSALLPISSNSWWFVTAYVVLFLFIPLINYGLHKLTDKQLGFALILLWAVGYVPPVVFSFKYEGLQRALFFYVVGAWIRRSNFNLNRISALILFSASWCVFSGLDIAASLLGSNVIKGLVLKTLFDSTEIAFCVPVCVVALFLFFKNCNIGYNKVINTVASTTLGVYLIHDSGVGRTLIWDKFFHCLDVQYASVYYPLFAIATIVTVFLCCSVIEYIRQVLFERHYMPLVYKKLSQLISA